VSNTITNPPAGGGWLLTTVVTLPPFAVPGCLYEKEAEFSFHGLKLSPGIMRWNLASILSSAYHVRFRS
jgi:hypothetical protein